MGQQNFFNLDGQVALVTGGGQGIGEGIVQRLHAAGARVAVLDLNQSAAEAVARAAGGLGLQCDVASAASVDNAIKEVRKQLGPIDILVNNAGIAGRTVPLWQLDEGDLDRVYAVNLKGTFLMCRAVIQKMMERQ